jgi:hypothetical protein
MKPALFFALALPLAAQGVYHRTAPAIPSTARLADGIPLPPPSAPINIFVTAGAGDQAPGPGAGFGYWSLSKYLGQENYATAIQEYRFFKGQVLTCSLGGISHAVAGIGRVTFGLTGSGGVCSGTTTGAGGTAEPQGFMVFPIGGPISGVLTVRKNFFQPTCDPKIPDPVCKALGRDVVQITLGIGWGK